MVHQSGTKASTGSHWFRNVRVRILFNWYTFSLCTNAREMFTPLLCGYTFVPPLCAPICYVGVRLCDCTSCRMYCTPYTFLVTSLEQKTKISRLKFSFGSAFLQRPRHRPLILAEAGPRPSLSRACAEHLMSSRSHLVLSSFVVHYGMPTFAAWTKTTPWLVAVYFVEWGRRVSKLVAF